jgi:two-component system, sensor histidine kinase SagS
MDTVMKLQRILVLDGPSLRNNETIGQLKQHNELVMVQTIDEAINALRNCSFDAILAECGDFLPLERAAASLQSSLILDTLGEGVCMVGPTGRILWANKRMRLWNSDITQRICQVCCDAFAAFSQPVAKESQEPATSATAIRSRKFSINTGDNRFFELVCSPVLDSSGRACQVAAICWDATHTLRLQKKLDAIDQAGSELVRLEGASIAKLNVMERLGLLEEKIIKFCRQLMQFDHFNIRLLDRSTNKLEPVISVGMPPEASEIELFSCMEGNGISGYVAATGRSYISPDVARDPRYVPGLDTAKSSLTVPLMLRDQTIGIFNIESSHYAFFTEDDRQFAEIFGRYVALALNILDLLRVERSTTSGNMVRELACEVAGPLNDISSDLTAINEQYIGNDDMQRRMTDIMTNVESIRRSIKAVSEGSQIILGVTVQPPPPDQCAILRGKRILIADDQATIRDTLHDVLVRCGCIVDAAADGAQACAKLASEPRYDLVISDIKMPHKNGYEIFSAAQKLGHKPPVILMTGFGYDENHSIVRASQEGLAAVLFKPFKVEKLMKEIIKALHTDQQV